MSYLLYKEKAADFLLFLEQEKNVSLNTVRAYRADLAQFLSFWERVEDGGPIAAATPSYVMQR